MDPEYTHAPPLSPSRQSLTPDSLLLLKEGIHYIFSAWTALQMAVTNEWGGRDSRLKYDEFSPLILSWFSDNKDELYIDDLEALIAKNMIDSFNAQIEDLSIEEVAEKLMIIHEECLEGKSDSIEKLRKSNKTATSAISQSIRQVNDENEDESSDDEEEASEMMVDDTKQDTMNDHKRQESADEKGWSVVASRKNRGGKRSS